MTTENYISIAEVIVVFHIHSMRDTHSKIINIL